MNRRLSILLLALLPAIIAQAATGNGNAKGRSRGTKDGAYSLTIAGQFKGAGGATFKGNSAVMDITATLIRPDGTTGALTIQNIRTNNDRFTATGTAFGAPCTIEGRIDLPAATDDETTDNQAATARITATLKLSSGSAARLVGIQDDASRPSPNNGKANLGNGNPATGKPAKP